jgi:hypothetical protein
MPTPISTSPKTEKMVSMSELLQKSLLKAFAESRLHVGLINCIDFLNMSDPSKIFTVALNFDALNPNDDDISKVILETYCFENKIPFIKADSKVLKRLLRFTLNETRRSQLMDACCVLIQKPQELDENELDLLKLVDQFEMRDERVVILNSQVSSPSDHMANIQFNMLNHTVS